MGSKSHCDFLLLSNVRMPISVYKATPTKHATREKILRGTEWGRETALQPKITSSLEAGITSLIVRKATPSSLIV